MYLDQLDGQKVPLAVKHHIYVCVISNNEYTSLKWQTELIKEESVDLELPASQYLFSTFRFFSAI